ncbi:M15 family metallopeptidase [Streptosporangium sp. NPDC051022]|uniref:M15 family metallopeptidase n=1 Tax=Streptosporangium sp. NPDC051022 TaxID=3155752 RepID=UPI003441F7B7
MRGSRFVMRIQATLVVAVGCLAAACGTTTAPQPAQPGRQAQATQGAQAAQPPAASSPAPSAAPTSAAPAPTPTRTGPPKFTAKVSKVTRDQVRYSWRPGCPVPLDNLRMITMTYWGFDDKPHTGRMVVNKDATDAITTVFGRLYGWRWPIYKMEPVDAYKGDDFDSIDANNTSAFNCRAATGSSNWSQHAYGRAVDINPLQNPYVSSDGTVAHKNARRYAKRPVHEPGVINPGDRVVKAFQQVGWEWGGYWTGIKDYQHFSKSGN